MLLIEGAQDVPDIIAEVLEAHKFFERDYDKIYSFFDRGSVREICKRLFNFCKSNIVYVVEGDQQQTTKAPQATLSQGYGDCKHYAGFIGGILSAIVRNTGRKINWKYRFASYSMLTRDPGHVFVCVYDRTGEIWIDPVLNYFDERLQPCFITDKKIKDMPLYRVSGIGARVGIDPITAATTALQFIKLFTGDKVPNYPIGSPDTLEKIRAHIQSLVPLPPKDIADAQRLLTIVNDLMAPLVGDTDNVRKTYYMIYGEYKTALLNYITKQSGGSQVYYDPLTGETLTTPPQTAGTSGSWIKDNMLIIAIAGAAILFVTMKKRRSTY